VFGPLGGATSSPLLCVLSWRSTCRWGWGCLYCGRVKILFFYLLHFLFGFAFLKTFPKSSWFPPKKLNDPKAQISNLDKYCRRLVWCWCAPSTLTPCAFAGTALETPLQFATSSVPRERFQPRRQWPPWSPRSPRAASSCAVGTLSQPSTC